MCVNHCQKGSVNFYNGNGCWVGYHLSTPWSPYSIIAQICTHVVTVWRSVSHEYYISAAYMHKQGIFRVKSAFSANWYRQYILFKDPCSSCTLHVLPIFHNFSHSFTIVIKQMWLCIIAYPYHNYDNFVFCVNQNVGNNQMATVYFFGFIIDQVLTD